MKHLIIALLLLLACPCCGDMIVSKALDADNVLVLRQNELFRVNVTDGKSTKVGDVDSFGVDISTGLMGCALQTGATSSEVSLYTWSRGAMTRIAHGNVNGVVSGLSSAGAVGPDMPARLAMIIRRDFQPGQQAGLYQEPCYVSHDVLHPGQLIIEPVPMLAGIARFMVDGGWQFSRDQAGWFAGLVYCTQAARDAYPVLPQRKDRTPMAFVILSPTQVKYSWKSIFGSMQNADEYREVLQFKAGSVLVHIHSLSNSHRAYWTVDAASGAVTTWPLLDDSDRGSRVLAVNDKGDAAVLETEQSPSSQPTSRPTLSYDVSVKRARMPTQRLMHYDSSETRIGTCFVEDKAVVTDGATLWISTSGGPAKIISIRVAP